MNIDNIKKTIEALRRSNSYNQKIYAHSTGDLCGTPACIAGHAIMVCTDYIINGSGVYEQVGNGGLGVYIGNAKQVLKHLFGISATQVSNIVNPTPLMQEVTKEDAVKMLQRLIITGQVIWEKDM